MAVITWPPVLRARAMNAHQRTRAVSGGRSISGIEQRVMGDAGYWALSIEGIVVNSRARAAAYRWLIGRLRAGDDVIVPVCDLYKPLGARGGATVVTLGADAALRATTLHLIAAGIDIEPGHHLSIAGRLYLVDGIVAGPSDAALFNPVATDTAFLDEPWSDAVSGSAAYTLSIFPPLRAPASAGTAVTFDDLRLTCRIDDMASGDLSLDLGRLGSPSLSLVEAF